MERGSPSRAEPGAVIEQASPITPPVIHLIVPTGRGGGLIVPSNTIAPKRQPGAVDMPSQAREAMHREDALADTLRSLVSEDRATLRNRP